MNDDFTRYVRANVQSGFDGEGPSYLGSDRVARGATGLVASAQNLVEGILMGRQEAHERFKAEDPDANPVETDLCALQMEFRILELIGHAIAGREDLDKGWVLLEDAVDQLVWFLTLGQDDDVEENDANAAALLRDDGPAADEATRETEYLLVAEIDDIGREAVRRTQLVARALRMRSHRFVADPHALGRELIAHALALTMSSLGRLVELYAEMELDDSARDLRDAVASGYDLFVELAHPAAAA